MFRCCGQHSQLKSYFYPVLVLKDRHALMSVVIYLNNVIVSISYGIFVLV